jgi:hypothetical protein
MTALRAFIAYLYSAEGSPVDLLHVEHLPTVGLLLGTMAGVYYLFRKRWLRWGPEVDLLIAEKDARIAELCARVIAEHEDSEKWSRTAWDIARAAGRMSETTKEATHTVRVLAENGQTGAAGEQQATGR